MKGMGRRDVCYFGGTDLPAAGLPASARVGAGAKRRTSCPLRRLQARHDNPQTAMPGPVSGYADDPAAFTAFDDAKFLVGTLKTSLSD